MQRTPRKACTPEQAMRLALEEGMTIPRTDRQLSLSPKTLANWSGST